MPNPSGASVGQTCSEVCSAVVKDARLLWFDISTILRIYGQNIYMLTSQLLVDPDTRRKLKTMMRTYGSLSLLHACASVPR